MSGEPHATRNPPDWNQDGNLVGVGLVGVGVDVVSVQRFAETLRRTPGIADRILSPGEQGQARTPKGIAAAFSAKEAVMKSLGSGLKDIALKDIAVGAMAVGDTIATPVGGRRALVELTGRAQDEARKRGVARVEVEITQEADSTGRPFLVAEAYAFDLSI